MFRHEVCFGGYIGSKLGPDWVILKGQKNPKLSLFNIGPMLSYVGAEVGPMLSHLVGHEATLK